MAPHPALSPLLEPERGCVVLDQPQHAASSRRLRTCHALRLVFDTAALRSNGAGRGIKGEGPCFFHTFRKFMHRVSMSVVILLASVCRAGIATDNWPQFRGPSGDGCSEARGLPLTWSQS